MDQIEVLGPKGLPLTGNLLAFRKDKLGFLRHIAQEYGDVVRLRFGRQRRLMQPSFRQDHIARYGDTMVRHTEQMLATWQDGEERLFTKDMMELTLSIITDTMFGANMMNNAHEIGHAIEVGLKYVSNRAKSRGRTKIVCRT